MNYSKLEKADLVNGPGVRVSLFVSGCRLNCSGCFNKVAQDFKAGQEFTKETVDEILSLCENEFISGLSILGGEPLDEKNIKSVVELLDAFRGKFGYAKTVWLWSGFTLEELRARGSYFVDAVLEEVDVLVDGRFVEALKDPTLPHRGSSNQRVLHKGKDF